MLDDQVIGNVQNCLHLFKSADSGPSRKKIRERKADIVNSVVPNVVVIAGPNGSGKSTAAPFLLRDYLGVKEFVNADIIAEGLSAFDAAKAAVPAGRIMLARLDELAASRADFAFETTLAARSFSTRLEELKVRGYQTHLIFLWLPTPEMAIARVASRVRQGGHNIPDDVIRRRYDGGLRNFFQLYSPVVDTWRMFDNSNRNGYELIAQKLPNIKLYVENPAIWNSLVKEYQ